MNEIQKIELFTLKCAVIESGIRSTIETFSDINIPVDEIIFSDSIQKYIRQFDIENRRNAARMANYYQIFYMLENDIRRIIVEILEDAHKQQWWDNCVPVDIKTEVEKNRKREDDTAISIRSENLIDYTTFGQLGVIITHNWRDFAGIMSTQSAVTRVMSQLNMLRGNIAHCGVLAEDEVDRLLLAIKDWFRILEGPRK